MRFLAPQNTLQVVILSLEIANIRKRFHSSNYVNVRNEIECSYSGLFEKNILQMIITEIEQVKCITV